jgi:hypothetical protein
MNTRCKNQTLFYGRFIDRSAIFFQFQNGKVCLPPTLIRARISIFPRLFFG